VSDQTDQVIGPVSIERVEVRPEGRRTDSVQAEFSGTKEELESLGLAGVLRDRYARWSATLSDPFGRLLWTRVYHDVPEQGDGQCDVHYAETRYGYDCAGRQNRVIAPGGTITRTVFDALGRTLEVYVGTDDAGATADDPTGGGTNNMKIVTENPTCSTRTAPPSCTSPATRCSSRPNRSMMTPAT